MKNVLIIVFIFITNTCMSQAFNGVVVLQPAENDSVTYNFTDTAKVKNGDIEYLRYCLSRYHKSRADAYWWMGASSLFTLMYVNSRGDEKQIFGTLAVLSFTGTGIIFAKSEKWIKQAAIKPTENGIGFILEF